MKYEMIFGDDDFSGQSNELAEVKIWHDRLGQNFVSLKELSRMNLEGAIPHGSVMLAMRRIIAEPKRWTVEDKMAGRLPDVGAKYNVDGCEVKHLGVGAAGYEDIFHFEYPSGACGCSNKIFIKQIETPEERAQREEDEFVDSESFFIDVCTMSGPMKAAYKQGARAAYRKLKGGE